MATNLHHTTLIKRIIDMGLHLSVNGDTTMHQDGFSLVAADAVQRLHDKVEQLAGLFHLACDSLVIVAGHPVVVRS